MNFHVEFNELKCSLEGTVARNPILNREQEFYIFSCIDSTKNKIFLNCLEDEEVYSHFLEIIRESIKDNNEHELFMIDSFKSTTEYDDNIKNAIDFSRSITSLDKKDVITRLHDFNISYDIYNAMCVLFESKHENDVVNIALHHDMQYYVNKIYLSNMKIILRILSSYRNTNDLTVKDLFSEGTIGLKRAIELFNCRLDIKFSTYASQWIKASINRAIADKDSLIRIPVNVREQAKEVEKIRKELRNSLNREPEEEEIISRMKKKVSSLVNLDISFAYYQIDINPRENSGDSNTPNMNASFEDNLVDTDIADEADRVTIKELRDVIKKYVLTIGDTPEQYYLKYHFGVNETNQVKNKEEILCELNIGVIEYDRIRKRALSNMRKALSHNKVLIDAYSIASGWDANSNLEI